MGVMVKDVLSLAKTLPIQYLEEAYAGLLAIKERADAEKQTAENTCPRCGSDAIVRNGKQSGKQTYLCKTCKKGFTQVATSTIAHSHSSEAVWHQVVSDTVHGVSLNETANSLGISHSTAFHMRHKILHCVESMLEAQPALLEGVCEADETYILESKKGTRLPEGYHRKARKHGAKASKRGVSNEYICVQTSITGEGKAVAVAANRASPSKEEIDKVLSHRITANTTILCDGNRNYDALAEKCTVAHVSKVNKVNGFHSFIKERNRGARGFATKYLNKYNALFSLIYANTETAIKEIFDLVTARDNTFKSISCVKSENLLNI